MNFRILNTLEYRFLQMFILTSLTFGKQRMEINILDDRYCIHYFANCDNENLPLKRVI